MKSLKQLLQACADIKTLKQIHARIFTTGLHEETFLLNKITSVYASFGSMENARLLFGKINTRNVFLWNVMIRGCGLNGLFEEALAFYCQMQQAGMQSNNFTFPFVLKACATLSALQEGKQIHCHVVRKGFELDVFVANALVDMYAKCGTLEVSRQMFDKMPKRDVVSWNVMIAGYAQNGQAREALGLFNEMQLTEMVPDSITMKTLLPACAHLAALQQGKSVHGYVIRSGLVSDVSVGNSLIDMYAKCGNADFSRQLFEEMPKRNVVSWSAMIAAYGMHGHGEAALVLFAQMQQMGIVPDDVTFICILSACSHSGLVDEGRRCFDCMVRDYCIIPRVEHYACLVDILGRAGHLDEARDLIKNMPLKPDAGVWGALLSACVIHGDIEVGEHAAEHILNLDHKNAGRYVQLSNIYAVAGRWDDVANVRAMMKEIGLEKAPGCSMIEQNSSVHAFLMGNRSHPQSEENYAMLESLAPGVEEEGYVPNASLVVYNV